MTTDKEGEKMNWGYPTGDFLYGVYHGIYRSLDGQNSNSGMTPAETVAHLEKFTPAAQQAAREHSEILARRRQISEMLANETRKAEPTVVYVGGSYPSPHNPSGQDLSSPWPAPGYPAVWDES